MLLHFIHTAEFERSWRAAELTDRELSRLQDVLCRDPNAGDRIVGVPGLRKIWIAGRGRGKRGGYRVVYFAATRRMTVYLLYVYAKSAADDLSSAGRRQLKRLAQTLEDEDEG